MVVSGKLNNGRVAGGWIAGKGFMKKCQTKVKRWNRPWYGPHRAHNQLKWWLRDTRGLNSAPRSFTVTHSPLPLHQSFIKDPDYSYIRIANGLGRSSQQKQTTQDYFILAVKLDSVLMCLCVCGKKLNFISWAIKLVFTDPVTNVVGIVKCTKQIAQNNHSMNIEMQAANLKNKKRGLAEAAAKVCLFMPRLALAHKIFTCDLFSKLPCLNSLASEVACLDRDSNIVKSLDNL